MSSAMLVALSSCEDYNDQFNLDSSITDVKNSTFTLTDEDYATIAGLPANQELALSKDPEGKSYVEALKEVGSNKYFSTMITADEFIPAFLSNKYPNADKGSRFVVTSNMYKEPSGYLADFKNISTYTLSSNDYKTIWGDYINATYLSPESLSKVPSLLNGTLKDAAKGDMVVLNYAYSETEPSTGQEVPYIYKLTNSLNEEGGNYVIAAKGSDGKYYPFGKLDDESKNYGYIYPDPINVVDGIISTEDGTPQVINVEKASEGFTLKNTWQKYIYMSGTYNNFNFSTSVPTEGANWKFVSNSDGSFSLTNIEKEKSVKLTLYNDSYSFGSYPSSTYLPKSYYKAAEGNDKNLTIKDVVLPEGSSFVWKYDSYGYWKASSFVGGKNLASESWLVSDQIDLTESDKPVLTFDGATRFHNGTPEKFMKVFVSDNFSGDVKTATWTEIQVKNWSDGSNWNFVNSGELDLSAYKGKKVNVAFKYESTTSAAPTWEIKNVYVREPLLYWDVYLFEETTENGVAANSRASRANVSANASALYVYDGETWALYSNSDAKVAVVDPTVYASVGSDYLSAPGSVIPVFLTNKYPYAAEGDRVAVVYNKSADKPVVVEYTLGAGWAETLPYEPTTITFVKENDLFVAQMSVYIDESFLGSEGGFTVQNVNLGGLTYVWQNTSTYGWKASAYYNGKNNTTESWLVSPAVNFKKAVAPQMIFDEAHRYLNSAAPEDYFAVKVSTNYKGDVTSCDWETLTVTGWSDGQTWDFVTVNPIDLSSYNGQTIYIAFQYKSDDAAAATWEIMNLKVSEKEEE